MELERFRLVGSGMTASSSRRDFLALASLGGLVFSSGLAGCGAGRREVRAPSGAGAPPFDPSRAQSDEFCFLQLSDTHWGFEGAANPEAPRCLRQTVSAINASNAKPDFIVFTGDLTHKTDDATERRARMKQFRSIVAELESPRLIFLPGEHDAAADAGEAYREHFGELWQSFEHRGVRFIALDNASAPGGALGEAQLDWLSREVERVPPSAPLVVLAHRPLFALYPDWDWATADGEQALGVLSRHEHVTVFYGHIHQEHHQLTGKIAHHSARSLIFPLPAPGAGSKRAPLPWDPASRDHGLGHRSVKLSRASASPVISEVPFAGVAAAASSAATVDCNAPLPAYESEVEPVLRERCFSCHTRDGAAADEHDFSSERRVRAERHAIARQLDARAMPPSSSPALSDEQRGLLARWAGCAGG